MHELSIAQAILEEVLRRAQEPGVAKVVGVHVVLEEAAAEVDDSLQFYWDQLIKGTAAEGARLHLSRANGDSGAMYIKAIDVEDNG